MHSSARTAALLLMTLVVALLLRPWDHWEALATVRPVSLLLAAIAVVWLADAPKLRLLADPPTKPLILLCLVAAATAPLSVWPSRSAEVAFNILQQAALLAMLAHLVTTPAMVERLATLMAACGTIHGSIATVTYLRQELTPDGRVFGTGHGVFADPNDLALSLVMIFPFAWWRFVESKSLGARLVAVGSLAVMLAGILASQSRGGLLAWGAAVVVLGVKAKSGIASLAGVVAAASLAAALLFPSDVFDRYSSIVHYQSDESATTRLAIWKAGASMFADHLLTGVGAGGFEVAYGQEYLDRKGAGNVWRAAHSSYIQIAAELGIFGLAAWLAFIAAILATLRRAGRLLAASTDEAAAPSLAAWVDAATASIVGFLVGAAFLSRGYDFLIVIIAGTASAVLRQATAFSSRVAPSRETQPIAQALAEAPVSANQAYVGDLLRDSPAPAAE
ncbi:MAG: O-antigen ligase family protein [Pirellulales bacterium]|nr:O-antigen ligase family protein [Pirellulales bacterium]